MPEVNSTIVMGLCATKEWKKAVDVQKTSSHPLNILIRKALRENEIDLVWDLLKQMTKVPKYDQFIASKTFLMFVKYFEKHSNTIRHDLDKLLSICEQMELMIDENFAHALTQMLQRFNHHAQLTTIDFS